MIYYFFYFVTFLNGLVLITALLGAKENRLPNLFFSMLLAAVLYTQGVVVVLLAGDIARFPYLLGSRFPFRLLIPALFYLYILGLTVPNFRWSRRYWLHFLPFFLGLAAFLVFLLVSYQANWRDDRTDLRLERYITLTISMIITGVYITLSFQQLRRFQKILPEYFSSLARIRLRWVKVLLVLFTIPWLIGMIDVLTGPSITIFEKIIVPIVTITILIMGFFALKQSVVFSGEDILQTPGDASSGSEDATPAKKTVSNAVFFSPEALTQWKDRLIQYIEKEKPYLEPEYRLLDLAKGLKLKTYQVSEILNRGLGVTFYDFINRYRIEEVKRLLQDPASEQQTILSLAMDSGYNSKSTFNDSFRKITGMTPSQYRNSLLSKSA